MTVKQYVITVNLSLFTVGVEAKLLGLSIRLRREVTFMLWLLAPGKRILYTL
jgi:hypothetical protein